MINYDFSFDLFNVLLPNISLSDFKLITSSGDGHCSVILPNQCYDNLEDTEVYWATFVLGKSDIRIYFFKYMLFNSDVCDQ